MLASVICYTLVSLYMTYMADMNGNTALWEAIASKHHSIFKILYYYATFSYPYTAGDLLCTAVRRNDLTMMKELLKHELHVDSKDCNGKTAVQVAMEENNVDMVNLLVMNGADITNVSHDYLFPSQTLSDMLQKREVGHRITVPDSSVTEMTLFRNDGEKNVDSKISNKVNFPRVSIYRGHPVTRRNTCCTEAGRLIRLPHSLDELKNIAGTFS